MEEQTSSEELPKAKEIELQKVLTCKTGATVKEISSKLKEAKERRIFVVDSDKNLKGIVTSTDLVYKVLTTDNLNLKAEDIMVSEVLTVDISEDLDKALEIMNNLKNFICPVTENGKILGIILYNDLVNYLLQSANKLSK